MIINLAWPELIQALVGGLLIGLSATLLLAFNGKIAGISGMVGGLFTRSWQELSWRALFIIGMLLGGVIASQLGFTFPGSFGEHNILTWIGAGLLVGIGTRLGNGCTSGHGICGIGRLSIRSMVATTLFILTAFIGVYLHLHLVGGA
ncbi:YeeE/YedE family protein [Dongshaea marina]|uniref:YeeE/YedE family protein n=1 Tax=Dongshaea marina TaxID=2047966 RepID=UPI000D3E5ADB|nr:YeeE/YedE thiosulfate transporter family protein [Dongshaea marina]